MNMRSVADIDPMGKKVLVRVDFNVELDDLAHVQEKYKLEVCKRTINFLLERGAASVSLISHYGRPEGVPDAHFSLAKVKGEAERILGHPITFVPATVGLPVSDAIRAAQPGTLFLLENLRFFPGEETNDPDFAKSLAQPFDFFVNEAFSVCHRNHASMVGVPTHLPSVAGFHLLEEVERLTAIKVSPARPAVAVIGGAKIETKLPLIRALEKGYDCVLVGGKIANEAIDQKIVFSDKVLLPQDFDSEKRLDIGPKTATYYGVILEKAKTIVWNGPLGKFEEKPYDFGTNMVLQAILRSQAYVVIGGGESLAVLERANAYNKIGFVSSGGGAMLAFLSDDPLPGLTALTHQ